MEILINQVKAQDPRVEMENFARLNLPIPPDFSKAGGIFNPLGYAPARGYFILLRKDLDTIDNLNGEHEIIMADDFGQSLHFNGMVISKEPQALTSGTQDDGRAAFLIEFSDKRELLTDPMLGVSINKMYNVPAPAWSTDATVFYDHSRNAGSDWTWQTMTTDIWNLMGAWLGSAPTLPITPSGTPNRWIFPGMNAWDALNQVLYRIGCAVQWDPETDTYTIVQVGTADSTVDAIVNAADPDRLIYNREFQGIQLASTPGTVRVFFHSEYQHYGSEQTTPKTNPDQWLATAPTPKDYATGITGTDPNVIHPLWDDMVAIYDLTGTLQNGAALQVRANERGGDFVRMIGTAGGQRNQKWYYGLLDIKPTGTIRGVAHRMDLFGVGTGEPGGLMTEIIRHPWWNLEVQKQVATPYDCWWQCENSTRITCPDFQPSYPLYPHLLQIVRTVSGPDGSGRYDAYVQQYNPATGTLSDKEQVWVRNLNP